MPLSYKKSRSSLLVTVLVLSSTVITRSSLAFQAVSSSRGSLRTITILSAQTDEPTSSQKEGEDKTNPSLLRLAELSLMDYDWRSSLFKSQEADRKIEESLARMMGDEPTYVRPKDASEGKIGPLVSTGRG